MQNLRDVNLAIASGSENVQNFLREMFIKQGANVLLCDFLNLDFVRQLEHHVFAEVILIDMDDTYDEDEAALDRLLDKIDVPVLFHENTFNKINDAGYNCRFSFQEIEKLAIKLAELANNSKKNMEEKSDSNETCAEEHINEASPAMLSTNSDYSVSNRLEDLINVWVLGASIGGPKAVKQFLSKIPADLPVAFVLAQHLGDGFVALLAEQMDKVSCFKVKEGIAGDSLRQGEVVIVPVDNRMILDSKGKIKIIKESWQGHYKPSIDSVIDNVTDYYQKKSGVIIFSGMGADGVLACQKFSDQYEGKVWAQSADTCVISSMPDSVRKAGLVSYSGSPEALALKIAVHYMGNDSHSV